MKTKQYAVLAILVGAAGAFIAFNPHAQSNVATPQASKLEGAWIMKMPGTPLTVTFTLSPDASGMKAAISGHTIIGDPTLFGYFPGATSQSPLVGQSVMTGPDRGVFTVVQYGLGPGAGGPPEILYIAVNNGTFKQVGPGKLKHQHNIAVYLPQQDADGDGLPDEGQSPIACIPLTTVDTRVPLLAPCTPPQ